jgi:hypothetical protein
LDWWWYHGFRNDSRCLAGPPQEAASLIDKETFAMSSHTRLTKK